MHTSKHTLTHIHEDEIRRGVSKEEKVDYHEWERDKKREMVKEEVTWLKYIMYMYENVTMKTIIVSNSSLLIKMH